MYVIKKYLSSVVVLTTFLLTASAFAMDTGFSDLPNDVRGLVVRQAAFEQCLDDNAPVKKTLGNLELVCREWKDLINDEMRANMPSWKAWYGVVGHEEIYQQFLNGVLIYRPNPQSDEGMIQLKVSDLLNPLEGTFDLSGCGDTGKWLSILTGYRNGMKAENSDKLEIWLTPRFMVEKKLKSSASHLQPIMDNWKEDTAPIGILWSWGGWDDLSWYDYLTSKNAREISSKNLYDNWRHAELSHQNISGLIRRGEMLDCKGAQHLAFFMFICEPK